MVMRMMMVIFPVHHLVATLLNKPDKGLRFQLAVWILLHTKQMYKSLIPLMNQMYKRPIMQIRLLTNLLGKCI